MARPYPPPLPPLLMARPLRKVFFCFFLASLSGEFEKIEKEWLGGWGGGFCRKEGVFDCLNALCLKKVKKIDKNHFNRTNLKLFC